MEPHYVILFIGLFLAACSSYKPFSSRKEKVKSTSMIKDSLNLNKDEFAELRKSDSILFIVSNSFKKEIKTKLIDRRLDSFFAKKYTEKELSIILQLDQINTHGEVEFERKGKFKERLKFNSIKAYEDFLKKLDSSILNSKFEVEVDTVKTNYVKSSI